MILPNYEIIATIAEGPQTVICMAYHKKRPQRLLSLKLLKAAGLSAHRQAQFRQKIEQLKVLNDSLLIVPLAFEVLNGTCVIIQDYFDGVPLNTLKEARPKIALPEFFSIACGLARALDRVHEAGIIHGGVKPHNILVNPHTLDIRLIDFISVVDVRDVSHFMHDPSFVRGTLAYTSPERTGRINHRVGFSSDLYSLGIVFYELLAGRLPFLSEDPLELIHSHLAEEAPRVDAVNLEIPAALSAIVAKLMRKAPEKRYQSSAGLLADLERCRDEHAATGTIQEFPLEKGVRTNRITFVSKMVGRDREAEVILEEYEQAARGEFRALFISGLSGIGKTRLIQELQKPIVRHRGYFAAGKFDVYQRNIPFSPLIQAFRHLMRTFLTESDDRVALWRERIMRAVGSNGRILTEVIPELEVLIGPQPEVRQLPPAESLNRFRDLFDRFLACLASEENPLTLFIDDLQWCDTASFDFMAYMFRNYRNYPYLFFLGAYRYNEVDSSHPLARLIHDVRAGGQPLSEIRLGPLQPEHCHEMVSYILDTPLPQTRALSDFIGTLSEGNPLFVSESLSYLYNEDLLYQDEWGEWQWDIERICQSHMPTSVVTLFGAKIHKLSPQLVTLLEYCACMGNTFSPAQLAALRGTTLVQVFETLKPALKQGLLIENKNQLQFIHDRVREAALSAIPAERRREIHWQVGTHLLTTALAEGERDIERLDDLFDIASHLNLGREDVLDAETAYLLSDINYYAGNKALNALAVEAANEFFRLSRELLPDGCWEGERYERTFRIYQKSAKMELMCGDYEASERLLNCLLEHAQTDLDKAECLAEQTTTLSSIGNFAKAIETANRGLAYFGKAIPSNPEEADRRRQALMAEIAAKDIDIWDTILNMPFTTDRQSKIELAIYSELIPDLYMSGLVPQLYLAATQSTQHCLAGGMDESVIYSFSIMGLQLGEQGAFEQKFRYEDLARELSAKYPNTFGATRGMNGIVWCNAHSRSHPRDIVDYCLKSIQCGKNCGDLYNAGLSYGPLMWNLQVQGADLSAIEDYARECLQFSQRYHLSFSVGLAEAMQAGWIEPMKRRYSPVPMEGKLRQWERDNHIASAGSYYVHRGLTHYYLGEYEQAQEYLVGVERYLSGLTDNVLKRQWHVFTVLNALKLYERGQGSRDERELLAQIQPHIEKVETWASLGPLLKPYLAFLYAELERVTGDWKTARGLYLDAINAAHEQEYTLLEGHLNECLAELLLQAGQCSERVYLTEAARLYKKCRAERKELNLIERYPEYFEPGEAAHLPPAEAELAPRRLPDLVIEYLIRSCLAISAEMDLDALLSTIMKVVIENSGAQRGYLLIEDAGGLTVRAESHVGRKHAVQRVNRTLDQADDICKAIVRYVHRTRETVLLHNASQEGAFKDHPEVQEMQLRSVLCLPVIEQSQMVGVLYLENRLADAVFTPERTQILELLASQAAIALENARLVGEMRRAEEALRAAKDELELRVQERTAELARANEQLARDIVERQRVEEMVIAERQRFNAILDMLPAYLVLLTPDFRVPFANRHFVERFGESGGRRCFEYLFGRSEPCENCEAQRVLETGVPHQWEWTGPDGREYAVFDFPFTDVDGSTLIMEMGIDVTDRKRAEAEIQKLNRELEQRVEERTTELAAANEELHTSEAHLRMALREKETLLKEIHHRVKNNLQIIHGMLNLQLPYIKDEQAAELFKEGQNRIYSMALIHEQLYRSESLARIDLAEYIRSLAANLFRSYGVSEQAIRLEIDVEDMVLDVNTVIPCALIINELVSNSLKHGFPRETRLTSGAGEISIGLRRDGDRRCILSVSDNGTGLPEGFDMDGCETLGLRLVSVLVRQLQGTIEVQTEGRTGFVIAFTEPARKGEPEHV